MEPEVPEAALADRPFDRDAGLADLLAAPERERLHRALAALLVGRVRVRDARGEVVLGDPGAWDGPQVPVAGELEPAGTLQAEGASPEAVAAAADLMAQVVAAARRYHMTADLHVDTVREDYRVLEAKHRALAAAEARERELIATLEARVEAQVATIQSAHRQLYQAEKLASVGQLAAGVAHEINNPIGFIRSNLRSAQDYAGALGSFAAVLHGGAADPLEAWRRADLDFLATDLAAVLSECLEGADRIAAIVADLKGFSRLDGEGEEPTDVGELLERVGKLGTLAPGRRVALEYDLAPGLPAVTCDPARLGQAFLNLLTNACQASEDGGRVRLAAGPAEGGVRVTVSDAGPGIPADVLPRVFEPFFTTRPVGQGTGLGLTVCRDTVSAYGGRIEVDSQPGRGTTFRVFLPAG